MPLLTEGEAGDCRPLDVTVSIVVEAARDLMAGALRADVANAPPSPLVLSPRTARLEALAPARRVEGDWFRLLFDRAADAE